MNRLIIAFGAVCLMQFAFCTTKEEFAALKLKAEGGDAESMCELGRCYRNGDGVQKDSALASEWTTKAASKGSERAKGVRCQFGYGVQTNLSEAVEWYHKAAGKGDAIAMLTLGVCYSFGYGVERDNHQAFDWYRKSAAKGNAKAMNNIAFFYESGKGVERDVKQAIKWYRKAAEKGNVKAMCKLGMIYKEGRGVEYDLDKAYEWFDKAAATGDAWAICQFGRFCENGWRDSKRASKLYLKAAELGDANAMVFIGDCYMHGNGVEEDEERGVGWYRRAAEQGNVEAMGKLESCYYCGKGVEKDHRQSFDWCRRAADKGDVNAMQRVATAYHYGQGVEKDDRVALAWLRKALELASGKEFKESIKEQIGKIEELVRETEIIQNRSKAVREAAKKHSGETLVIKSFYMGMTREDAVLLCKNYFGLDHGSEIAKLSRFENGVLTGITFARADIDKLFSVSGVSSDTFTKKLIEAYPMIDRFEVLVEEVPDLERQAEAKKSIDARWQAKALNAGGGFDTGFNMAIAARGEFDRIKSSITKSARVYRCESKKGFLLEIHDGLPDRFLTLKKVSVVNTANFD